MELGALVCTPGKPACDACPLARRCAARLRGIEQEIPALAKQAAPTREAPRRRRGAAAARAVLLVQRPAQGRWANLWEFPHAPLATGETDSQAAGRLLAEFGLEATLDGPLTTISHSVTRFRITVACLIATYRGGRFTATSHINARWLRASEIAHFPVSSPQRRLVEAVCVLKEPRTQ